MSNEIDFSKTLMRSHRSGDIMTEPRSKSETLSVTCTNYLRQLYRERKYRIRKDIYSKYLEKGIACEEDGITLYSRFRHKMFKKNEERIDGEFFTGEPDLYDGEEIRKATHIYDIKSCWDAFTFPFPDDKLDKGYYYQLQSYMALTGANEATLVYALCDTPEYFIAKEIDNIFYRTGVRATEEQAAKIRNNMTFSDKFSIEERIVEFYIKRDDAVIETMNKRVELCREYLVKLNEQICKNQ